MIRLRLNEMKEYKESGIIQYLCKFEAVVDVNHSAAVLDLSKETIKKLSLEVGCEYKLNLEKIEDNENE